MHGYYFRDTHEANTETTGCTNPDVARRASLASVSPRDRLALTISSTPSPIVVLNAIFVWQRLICSQCLLMAGLIPQLFRGVVDLDRRQKKAALGDPLIGIIGAGGQLG